MHKHVYKRTSNKLTILTDLLVSSKAILLSEALKTLDADVCFSLVSRDGVSLFVCIQATL